MNWRLSSSIDLNSPHIKEEDAKRQERTAAEILKRFDEQPGLILADEVGMGKTFVALAVAVSVIEATDQQQSVVVMIPPSVRDKWPLEWRKFSSNLRTDDIRATEQTITSSAEFLKLLDDPPETRKHLIFLTHGALSHGLSDPLLRLAIIKQALRSPRLRKQRKVFARWAEQSILHLKNLRLGEAGVEALLATPTTRWRRELERITGRDPGDDPVPRAVRDVLPRVDLSELVETLKFDLPIHSSPRIDQRLQRVREGLRAGVADVWREALQRLELDLPLLILDEAHHTKNRYTRLARLFASEAAQSEADSLRGELGGVFDRMLFLTATPFQLGHHELIEVLDRFSGVRWDDLERGSYERNLQRLRHALDASQAAALRLDRSWGRLTPADVPDQHVFPRWWEEADSPDLSPAARTAAAHWCETREKARAAERLLRTHVIRHVRADRAERRDVLPGRAIVTDADGHGGLSVEGPAVLPFLLAARAQAVVAMHVQRDQLRENRRVRAMFAEGLASSFEAYTRTRAAGDMEREVDDVEVESGELPIDVSWYLDRISLALPEESDQALVQHPKIAATVDRAVALWKRREKCLIFCFYIATGRALRRHIARGIEREVLLMAAEKLSMPVEDADIVRGTLDRYRDRLMDATAPARKLAETELRGCLGEQLRGDQLERSVELCLRFLRTSSFLVRYLDLSKPPAEAIEQAFDEPDASGRTFREVVRDFGSFIAGRETSEREHFLTALENIEVGDIQVVDDEGERAPLIANVRLANGATGREARERLMVAFNTPFYPEVLVASSVMAEGVDLHLTCRHVIHHDLNWNPSVIEQRTGRLDRIGSKGELTGLPIQVYEPFIEGAQDEKQFRVMRDRERWFNVVMGERLELDEWSTDQLADRVEFPEEAARGATMDLAVYRPRGSGR